MLDLGPRTIAAACGHRCVRCDCDSVLCIGFEDKASLDWSWAFVLIPLDERRRTRFLFRSRWVTSPWWFTLAGWLGIVPADFLMSRDMLHGVKQRVETLARQRAAPKS
jgi:hypothetical protein